MSPAPSMAMSMSGIGGMGMGMGGVGALGASALGPYASTPAHGLSTPMRPGGGMGMGMSMGGGGGYYVPPSAGAGAGAGPGPAALPASVGDWLRSQASPAERDNLVALMALLGDFQQRSGVAQPGRPGTVAEGGDALVISLGPRLKVGLRVYV